MGNKNSLRVMAPQDINLNSDAGAKRPMRTLKMQDQPSGPDRCPRRLR